MSVQPFIAMPPEVAAGAEQSSTIARSLIACFELKLRLYLVLSAVFCGPYFAIQRLAWLPPHVLSPNIMDRAAGFHPETIYLYQSVYLLIPVFPFLAGSREELFRYTKGFLWLCAVCFVTFIYFPVLGPRPESAQGNWMTQIVYTYDKNLNVFPSLHAGLAVYSVLFGFAISRIQPPLRKLAIVGAVWAGTIMVSTLTTKQHYFVDLPPAVVLAWIAHRWAWRRA